MVVPVVTRAIAKGHRWDEFYWVTEWVTDSWPRNKFTNYTQANNKKSPKPKVKLQEKKRKTKEEKRGTTSWQVNLVGQTVIQDYILYNFLLNNINNLGNSKWFVVIKKYSKTVTKQKQFRYYVVKTKMHKQKFLDYGN